VVLVEGNLLAGIWRPPFPDFRLPLALGMKKKKNGFSGPVYPFPFPPLYFRRHEYEDFIRFSSMTVSLFFSPSPFFFFTVAIVSLFFFFLWWY